MQHAIIVRGLIPSGQFVYTENSAYLSSSSRASLPGFQCSLYSSLACVTTGESFYLKMPQLPLLKNGHNKNSIYAIGWYKDLMR